MAIVSVTNVTGNTVNVVVVPDANYPSQRVFPIAAGAVLNIDSVVYSQSPDLYTKVTAGTLVVTAGSAPTQVADPAKSTFISNPRDGSDEQAQ